MDTLFRLVNFQYSSDQQQSSFNSSTHTSSSSRSHQNHVVDQSSNTNNNNNNNYYYNNYYNHSNSFDQYYQDQECGTNHQFYMDEDFSSSSSSRLHPSAHQPRHPLSSSSTPSAAAINTTTTPPTLTPVFEPAVDLSLYHELNLDFSSPSSSSGAGAYGAGGGGRWASQLLLECARALSEGDSQRVQQLMWMLNELSSPYGEVDQKISSYFLQGLFARLTSSGVRTLRTLSSASDRNCSFDSTRRTALRFQELSPWSSFGHVAANGAILEAFLDPTSAASTSSSGGGTQRIHILDLSNTFCTQWPTLLEALATRSSEDTPHLSITTVVSRASPSSSSSVQRVMKEIGQRMEKFARLMGVPFRFNVVHHEGDLSELDLEGLDLREGGAASLAVNCVNALRTISPVGSRRDAFFASLRRLQPRIVTVVEEEVDLETDDGGDGEGEAFLKVFRESLRFFSAYFDSLEESFPRTSNERLALERTAGRAMVDLVACPAAESTERRETGTRWSGRMRAAGFAPQAFSEDVADDVKALLRRYREGWSMRAAEEAEEAGGAAGIFLGWKDQAMVWASAWRP